MSGRLRSEVARDTGRAARLLFVHAHPDDETLTTGLTMASYASRHHDVHLLTCTLGEQGEVIPPELAHLAADRDDTLGPYRRQELQAAMSVLGVTHSVLGQDPARGVLSRYRDSGMAGTAGARHPDAFAAADPAEATAMVAAHIRALRPDVVVTYDAHGGYGHPDHIQVHRVGLRAAELAGTPRVYQQTTSREHVRRGMAAMLEQGAMAGMDPPNPEIIERLGTPESDITCAVDVSAYIDHKRRAMRAHASQISEQSMFLALPQEDFLQTFGMEWYIRTGQGPGITETDLMAGLPTGS